MDSVDDVVEEEDDDDDVDWEVSLGIVAMGMENDTVVVVDDWLVRDGWNSVARIPSCDVDDDDDDVVVAIIGVVVVGSFVIRTTLCAALGVVLLVEITFSLLCSISLFCLMCCVRYVEKKYVMYCVLCG